MTCGAFLPRDAVLAQYMQSSCVWCWMSWCVCGCVGRHKGKWCAVIRGEAQDSTGRSVRPTDTRQAVQGQTTTCSLLLHRRLDVWTQSRLHHSTFSQSSQSHSLLAILNLHCTGSLLCLKKSWKVLNNLTVSNDFGSCHLTHYDDFSIGALTP